MPAFVNPIKSENFVQLVDNLFSILEKIAIGGLAIALVYAGYLFSTGEGDPEKINMAKKTIFWSVVGAGIIFLGKFLVKMIVEALP